MAYLLLGKEKHAGFHRLSYCQRFFRSIASCSPSFKAPAPSTCKSTSRFWRWILDDSAKAAYRLAYDAIHAAAGNLKIIVATYFDGLRDNVELAVQLPVQALHIDLVRAPEQLNGCPREIPANLTLSLGLVDGRNIWKDDWRNLCLYSVKAAEKLGVGRLMIAPSCSLLHVPCDLSSEKDEVALPKAVKRWLAFARQKLDEVVALAGLSLSATHRRFSQETRQKPRRQSGP